MDEDDGLPALAPQWLKAGKPTGATGGGSLQGGGSFPKPEADSARIPASGGPGRRSGPAAAPRSKPAHLQPAWRPEHPPLNSLGGFSPNFSGERRPVGQLSHNSADAARGHQARDKASLPRPRASDDVLGRRPAPLLTPRRAQPGLRYAKEFDSTFPHLASRPQGTHGSALVSGGLSGPGQSAWQKPVAQPNHVAASSADSKWISRLAQPAIPDSPSPATNGTVARDSTRPLVQPGTPRSSRALVPMPVTGPRGQDRNAALRASTSTPAAQRTGEVHTDGSGTGSNLTVLTRAAPAAGETSIAATPGTPASPSSAHPSAKAGGGTSGKGREEQNDRNSFFQSLRSKASCGPHILSSTLSSSTASGLSEQEALSASASRQPSLEPADLAASAHDAAYAASSSDAKQCNGNGTAHQDDWPSMMSVRDAQLLAEEEAFLRSLGWHESDDESQGGLTEEEIAAFQARLASSPAPSLHVSIEASQQNGQCSQ